MHLSHIWGMKLKDWMARQGITQTQFADMSGISQSTISRLTAEPPMLNPSRKIVRAIVAATGGCVTANDLFDLAAIEQ